jgi:hypothetical protein
MRHSAPHAALILAVFFLCALCPLWGQRGGVFSFAGDRAGSSYSGDISGDRFEELEGRGLLIRTKPAGARVFIDGLERGETPLLLDSLVSGEYRVRLVKDSYAEREFTVYLLTGSRLDVSIELEAAQGRVLLQLRREDASPAYPFSPGLFVDGVLFTAWTPAEPEGETGAAEAGTAAETGGYTLALPVGRHSLRVASFGWEDAVAEVLVRHGETSLLELSLKPAPFRLIPGANPGRPRFNPANPGALGSLAYRFGVSGPGTGVFRVLDQEGREVYTEDLPPFKNPFQQVVWNGRDFRGQILPDGDYTLVIEAAPPEFPGGAFEPPRRPTDEWRLSLPVSVDSSLTHYPLTLFGAVSGLLFAPLPLSLPQGGFQVEGNILFGQTPALAGEGAFSSLPFEVGFRFAPLEGLEFSAALEATPVFGGAAEWGFSFSPKWRFLKAGPLEAATAAGFSWSGDMDISPRRGGLSLYLPLSWTPLPSFSLVLDPGLYWRQWREGSPRLLLGAGAQYRFYGFSAGFSLRQEYRLHEPSGKAEDEGSVVLLWAAELKWQPPRTNLVFTVLGGSRYWNAASSRESGGFGGLGMGIIY